MNTPSKRTINSLAFNELRTKEDVITKRDGNPVNLMKLPYIGQQAIKEIEMWIDSPPKDIQAAIKLLVENGYDVSKIS